MYNIILPFVVRCSSEKEEDRVGIPSHILSDGSCYLPSTIVMHRLTDTLNQCVMSMDSALELKEINLVEEFFNYSYFVLFGVYRIIYYKKQGERVAGTAIRDAIKSDINRILEQFVEDGEPRGISRAYQLLDILYTTDGNLIRETWGKL